MMNERISYGWGSSGISAVSVTSFSCVVPVINSANILMNLWRIKKSSAYRNQYISIMSELAAVYCNYCNHVIKGVYHTLFRPFPDGNFELLHKMWIGVRMNPLVMDNENLKLSGSFLEKKTKIAVLNRFAYGIENSTWG